LINFLLLHPHPLLLLLIVDDAWSAMSSNSMDEAIRVRAIAHKTHSIA